MQKPPSRSFSRACGSTPTFHRPSGSSSPRATQRLANRNSSLLPPRPRTRHSCTLSRDKKSALPCCRGPTTAGHTTLSPTPKCPSPLPCTLRLSCTRPSMRSCLLRWRCRTPCHTRRWLAVQLRCTRPCRPRTWSPARRSRHLSAPPRLRLPQRERHPAPRCSWPTWDSSSPSKSSRTSSEGRPPCNTCYECLAGLCTVLLRSRWSPHWIRQKQDGRGIPWMMNCNSRENASSFLRWISVCARGVYTAGCSASNQRRRLGQYFQYIALFAFPAGNATSLWWKKKVI